MTIWNRGHLLLVMPLLLAFLAAASNAGYIISYNTTLTVPSTMAIAYNVNGTGNLVVLNSTQYGSYQDNKPYTQIYNKSVTGDAMVIMNLSPGLYHLLLYTRGHGINGTFGFVDAPLGQGHLIHITSNYSYPVSWKNYSQVNISWIGTRPFNLTSPYGTEFATNTSIGSWNVSYYNRGAYRINFSPSYPTAVFFYVNATPVLVNPFGPLINNFSQGVPVGIVSYGLSYLSGRLSAYQVSTNEIGAMANITSIEAYNASPPPKTSRYGATLQLNVQLRIQSGGNSYTYWLQNAMDLNTSNRTYSLVDNVWNESGLFANVYNSTVRGMGNTSVTTVDEGSASVSQSSYAFSTSSTPYSYPLYFYPVTRVGYSGGYPVVYFSYYNTTGLQYYDNVTFHIPSNNATLLVTPYYQTPSRNQYNSEFVFGGEGSAEMVDFSNTSAYLSMYYSSGGRLVSFPSFLTFGSDSAETGTGIKVAEQGNVIRVGDGIQDFNTIILAQTLSPSNPQQIVTTKELPKTSAATTSMAPQIQTPVGGVQSHDRVVLIMILGAVVLVIAVLGLYRALKIMKRGY